MKHKWIKFFLLALSLLLAVSPALAVPSPATAFQAGTEGDTPTSPESRAQAAGSATQADDEHFVADVGGELDQYLFRTNGDGYIRFSIPITRYYFIPGDPNIQFENGFLKTAHTLNYVKSKEILPAVVSLKLKVWDVDEESSWCPEVDYVFVNGTMVPRSGKLSGANETWSEPSFQIPIEVLKFPESRGTNGNRPTAAQNEIAIQVDANGCTTSTGDPAWAVEVAWGVIEIPSPVRPIIFAHGWTGSTTDFDEFEKWMGEEGRQSAGQVDLDQGLSRISTTALMLKAAINQRTREFGVNKLNVFAHSKGGLVTRKALDDSTVANQVDNVITFSTPHHGTLVSEADRIEVLGLGLIQWKCLAQFGTNLIDAWRCDQAAQEFTIDAMRNFNYIGCTRQWPWSAWENCTPNQGRKQPNISYYSFAANGDEVVVPLKSTTYPWKATAPFPSSINVDQIISPSGFPKHSTILDNRTAYVYAINYLSSGSPFGGLYAEMGSEPVEVPAVGPTDNEYQLILSEWGTLNAGSTQAFASSVESGTLAIFEAKSEQALTYTLIAPNGQTVDPTLAAADPNIAYVADFDGISWFYQYQVSTPLTGTWQNNLSAGTATSFVVSNLTNSTIQLGYKTDKFTYHPGDLVTLETALSNGSVPYTGVAFTGTVTHPDNSSESLAFYDDGSHGDLTPNNGVYTAEFTALSTNGHAVISLGATKGSITRLAEASIAVASQTAQFQYVNYEYPLDTNGNGLYDNLNIDIYADIIQSGQFEFQGTLVDGAGQPVATGYYSSLMAGTGPLSTGWQSIELTFDGSEIYQHGVNGPYSLTNFTIYDVSEDTLEVDTATNVYATAAYSIDQFEHETIALAGGSDEAFDEDGNGLYDWLLVTLNVNVAVPGDYDVNGRLVNPGGSEIAWTAGQFYAPTSGVYPVDLWFDGYEIGAHKSNGPFTIQDVSISDSYGINDASFGQAYTTQAYSVLDFDGVFATFADAPTYHWAWNFIERLYGAGITGGCGSSPMRYCPEDTVTRAQMAVFLERGIHGASYVPPAVGAGTGFGDVPPSYWSASFIKQLVIDGITVGCGSGNYCPEQPVTRAQMAVFLLRSKHGGSYVPPGVGAGTGFGDVPANYWSAAWIKQLVTEGITSGCGGGNYCPEQPVTRAQMAVFLVRTFNLP
jgi:triacylglycerol esterase/lipase EstA (alpha/beta hydrolase family)